MAIENLKKWRNGDNGAHVQEVINYNFELLARHIDHRIFTKIFTVLDWEDGKITISYREHKIDNPNPHVSMEFQQDYVDVYGSVYIDKSGNVSILSDIPFDGRIVIK